MSERARLTKVGWEEDLTYERSDATPADPAGNQVLIEVEACGVCFRDCIDRSGRFKFIQTPITPGHEAVGRVVAVGPDVTDWSVGDRVATTHRDFCGNCVACQRESGSLCQGATGVLGLLIDGGYASHLMAPERCFYAMDQGIPATEAAVLHCTFGTSYRGLARFGGVGSGQQVLVTGANGGVGSAAVQVASRLGATVTAVTRDERHAEYLTKLGAQHVIVDAGDRFHKELSAGPVDVVMDCVGPPTFNSSLRSLRPGGKMIVVGNVVEERASVNLGFVVTRGLQIIGSSGATRADMRAVLELHAEKPFSIEIHEKLDLEQADRAQRMVQAGGLHGRIVLVPKQGS
ncbi:MAG: zinc-binding dehydrogenase [Myxococcales bacterium]|nr:zinc-binding dehydrogenase [Myxococcales bacterium]